MAFIIPIAEQLAQSETNMRNQNITLYLIRHGESIRNLQPHLIGQHPDEPLSSKGEEQAKILGEYFRDNLITFNSIYVSPYKRALDTCLIACEQFNAKIDVIAPELREYSAGDFIDKNRNEVITPEVIAEMTSKGMSFKFPNGESLYEVEIRAAGLLETAIQEASEHDTIAFFSHGMTIKCLLHYIMKFNQRMTWRVSLDNTSICKLEMKRGLWHIHSMNDIKHLNR